MPRKTQTQYNNENAISLAVMASKLDNIKENVKTIKAQLDGEYATKEWCDNRFGQTTKTVNGILVAFGLAIVGALATFIIRGGLL